MAMNVGSPGGSSDMDVMIDINTTPLIDVMLVLLVMLIITLPIQLHSVNLNMPTGMFRLTECSWIGMVMISITSSTSITSISGVVLMSMMTSDSPEPLPDQPLIAMFCSSRG